MSNKFKKNWIEKIINLIDSFYHHKRIVDYLIKLNIHTLIDVGAHKGEFINNILKRISINKIYAFEPNKNNFKELKKKKIKLFKVALDNKIGVKKILINKLSSTSTLSKVNKKSLFFKLKNFITDNNDNYNKEFLVKTSTLDNIFKKKNMHANTLLKIDVEGYELNVLQGSKHILKKINYIIIENQFFTMYLNSKFKKCDTLLLKNNFKLLKRFIFPLLNFEDRLYIKK